MRFCKLSHEELSILYNSREDLLALFRADPNLLNTEYSPVARSRNIKAVYSMVSGDLLGCSTARNKGTCDTYTLKLHWIASFFRVSFLFV